MTTAESILETNQNHQKIRWTKNRTLDFTIKTLKIKGTIGPHKATTSVEEEHNCRREVICPESKIQALEYVVEYLWREKEKEIGFSMEKIIIYFIGNRHLLHFLPGSSIHHIYHEFNQVAHCLARWAVYISLTLLYFWCTPCYNRWSRDIYYNFVLDILCSI